MKYPIVLFGFAIVSALWGCSASKQTEYKEYYQELMEEELEANTKSLYDISDSAQELTDSDALRYFQDLYGLSSLEDQTLFWDKETLQLSYYFAPDVPSHQVDTARSYAINRFVLGSINKGNPTPYEHWMTEGGTRRDIPRVNCRVFVGDELLLQENYADKKLASSYENKKSVFPMRQYIPENEAEILELVNHYMKQPELTFQKGISDGTLIIHLQSDVVLAPEKIDALLEEWTKSIFSVDSCCFVFWEEDEWYYCR